MPIVKRVTGRLLDMSQALTRMTGKPVIFKTNHLIDRAVRELEGASHITGFPDRNGIYKSIPNYFSQRVYNEFKEDGSVPEGVEKPLAQGMAHYMAFQRGYRRPYLQIRDTEKLGQEMSQQSAQILAGHLGSAFGTITTLGWDLILNSIMGGFGFARTTDDVTYDMEQPDFFKTFSNENVAATAEKCGFDIKTQPAFARMNLFFYIVYLTRAHLYLPEELRKHLAENIGTFYRQHINDLLQAIDLADVKDTDLLDPNFANRFTPQVQAETYRKMYLHLIGTEGYLMLEDAKPEPDSELAKKAADLYDNFRYMEAFITLNQASGDADPVLMDRIVKALMQKTAQTAFTLTVKETSDIVLNRLMDAGRLEDAIRLQEQLFGTETDLDA